MKATLPPLAVPILRWVGLTLILLYLLDGIVLLSTAKFQDSQWMLAFTTQLVDRGFTPLVGIALLFTGFWVEKLGSPSNPSAGGSQGLKLSLLLLSTILGLVFFLNLPLHINANRQASDDQLKQVGQEAGKAEAQLSTQVQQLKSQVDARLSLIEQALKSGQVQGDQLAQAQREQEQLKQLKADPKALEAQIAPSRDQELTRIRNRKQELETQVRETSLRTGLRIGLSSLLLGIAYAAVGWFGLRRMFSSQDQL